jgi:hypothetical protein
VRLSAIEFDPIKTGLWVGRELPKSVAEGFAMSVLRGARERE